MNSENKTPDKRKDKKGLRPEKKDGILEISAVEQIHKECQHCAQCRMDPSILIERLQIIEKRLDILESDFSSLENKSQELESNFKYPLTQNQKPASQKTEGTAQDSLEQPLTQPGDINQSCPKQNTHKMQYKASPDKWISTKSNVPWRDPTVISPESFRKHLYLIKGYKPSEEFPCQTAHVNILLIGPNQCGKSGFVNSVDSFIQGQRSSIAAVGSRETSLTKKFRKYSFWRRDSLKPLRFQLWDTPGLETIEGTSSCFNKILDGEIPDKANLMDSNSWEKLSSSQPGDPVHCVVYVIDVNMVKEINENERISSLRTLRNFQDIVIEKDIAQLVLLCKIDDACTAIKQNVENLFYSNQVPQLCCEAAQMLGLPPFLVLPMINYHDDCFAGDQILALSAYNFYKMLQCCGDFLRKVYIEKHYE